MKIKEKLLILKCRIYETVVNMMFVMLTVAFFIVAWSGEKLKALIIFIIIVVLRYLALELKEAIKKINNWK